jgi:hypothetical protein
MSLSHRTPRRLLGGLLASILLFGCTGDRVTTPDVPASARMPAAASTSDVPSVSAGPPQYVRGPAPPNQAGVVRVYQDEIPWFGSNRAHASLLNIGKELGVDYFIHPLIDLQAPGGIPAGTRLVIITSNSQGDPGQAQRQNHPDAQENLANFLRGGGHLIVDMGDNLETGGFIAPGAQGTPNLSFPDPCDRGMILDPGHPLFAAFHTLNDDDVSLAAGFCSVAHGNLEQGIQLPPDAVGLVDAMFPPQRRLILAEYCFEGVGRVILDTMTKEFAGFPPAGNGPSRFMDNLFSYALSGAADCDPADVIEVDIDNAYSGDPPQAAGIINLADTWVYVEILDIFQYPMHARVSPFRSASDVRIGGSWETGVPAESFALPDINNDGNRDFRGRWSLAALQNAGLLPLGPTTLVVWGRDPNTGQDYRGEIGVTVVGNGMPPACTHDNGGFVTHPGGGTGPIAGADVSMSSPAPHNTAGSNVLLSGAGPHFRIADDFAAGPQGCVLSEVITHGYRTGGAPNWTSANINIRAGSVTGDIVASATTTTWTFTGVYRTFNTVLNNADRPVYRLHFSFPDVTLAPGTYWIDWQVVGGTSAWANYVMGMPNPPGAFNPPTVFENGQQMFNAAGQWQPTLDPPGAEIPFLVRGPGAPPLTTHGFPAPTRPVRLPANYSQWLADGAQ